MQKCSQLPKYWRILILEATIKPIHHISIRHLFCRIQEDDPLSTFVLLCAAEFSKPNLEASGWLKPLLFYSSLMYMIVKIEAWRTMKVSCLLDTRPDTWPYCFGQFLSKQKLLHFLYSNFERVNVWSNSPGHTKHLTLLHMTTHDLS